ncbi:MAG: hypothetical protein MJ236_02465 [Clostridia bacterium]|nr:hypothetical protein [Clostridia bacterium]
MKLIDTFSAYNRLKKLNNIYKGKSKPINVGIDVIENKIAEMRKTEHVHIVTGNYGNAMIAAMYSLTSKKDSVLVLRDSSMAVYKAIELFELNPLYINPQKDTKYGFYGSINPDYVDSILDLNPNIKLVVIQSPTHEGIISDVKSIAEVCKSKSVNIIVDESLGTHLGLYDYFAGSCINENINIAIHSIKVPFCPDAEISIIHSNNSNDKKLLEMLMSLTNTVISNKIITYLAEMIDLSLVKNAIYSDWSKRIELLNSKFSDLKNLEILFSNNNKDEHECIYSFDKSVINIYTESTQYNGFKIGRILRKNKYNVISSNEHYASIKIQMNISNKDVSALVKLIHSIDAKASRNNVASIADNDKNPEYKLSPAIALSQMVEEIFSGEADERISAEYLWVKDFYHMILVPGEIIDDSTINLVKSLKDMGANVLSSDDSLNTFTVVKTSN